MHDVHITTNLSFDIEKLSGRKIDKRCFFIACASIVAKVLRDNIMETYHIIYPHYNFAKNKGYPTKDHRSAIIRYGVSPIHRKTFKGVKEYLVQ